MSNLVNDMFDFSGILNFFMNELTPYANRPNSTFFILSIALVLSLTTNILNRLLVDVERMKEVMSQVTAWRKEFDKARKSGDKQLIAKATKKQKSIMQLQSRMMWDRMKVSFIYLGPFWIIFYILNKFYAATSVALSPFTVPILLGQELPFISWYILCSFTFSLPISRILGVNPET
jgi:uncharacterized membrane protein (DUF106 family)